MNLFDDEPSEAAEMIPEGKPPRKEYPPHSTWNEVPASLFLSWSRRRQLAYCATRDEDAAAHAYTPEDAAWYRERAEAYRSEIVSSHNIENKEEEGA